MKTRWIKPVLGLFALATMQQSVLEGNSTIIVNTYFSSEVFQDSFEPEEISTPINISATEDLTLGELIQIANLREQLSCSIILEEPLELKVLMADGSELQMICKKLRAEPRVYEDGVSAKEAEDIVYILKSLANMSLAKLKGEESSLKKAGDRIDHVHPLQFLILAFTNEELKVCLRNLEGRSWVWKDFIKGITESLAQEYGRDNLMPYLDDFAAQLKVDTKLLMPNINNGRWEKFVTLLISIIPRAPGSDRYNM